MPASPTKWSIDADYLQACNCDYGCPCEFEAPPTMGFCEGMGAYRINAGRFGDVSMDGLGMAFAIKFPGPMHKGNGSVQWFIDEKASPQQRQALSTILSGSVGGMPFELFGMIFSKTFDPIYAPVKFNLNGLHSSVQVGDALKVQMEPIKNPVTGENESIRIEHGTGFIFKAADCVSAKQNELKSPQMSFSYPDKAGFVTRVKYGN
jgi:hypothetical protein